MNHPDCTLLVTNRNYAQYLKRCISSCLEVMDQVSGTDLIVIDDGSTDESRQLIKRLVKDRGKIIFLDGVGIEAACNEALAIVKTKFMCRVDADDFLDPKGFEILLSRARDGDVVYGDYTVVDEFDSTLSSVKLPKFSRKEFFSRGDFLATGTLIRVSDNLREIRYNQDVSNCGLENYELMINLYQAGAKFIKIDESCFYYRWHNKNMSNKRKDQIFNYGSNLYKQKNLGVYSIGEFHPSKLNHREAKHEK